jgi:hypothetical protein
MATRAMATAGELAVADAVVVWRSSMATATCEAIDFFGCWYDQFVFWCDQRRLEWAGVAQMSFWYRCNMNE